MNSLSETPNLKNQNELFSQIEAMAKNKLSLFMEGVTFYREHPFQAQPQKGQMILNLFGATLTCYGPKDGKPILIVPSLINTSQILDLYDDVSLISYLVKDNFQVFCLEWGEPDSNHLPFELTDYFTKILLPFLGHIQLMTHKNPHIMGYCMGGIFGLLLGQFASGLIDRLILLAPPFDFKVPNLSYDSELLSLWYDVTQKNQNHIAKEAIPYVFFIKSPFRIIEKYVRFNDSWSKSNQHLFVCIEDWLNDSKKLARLVGLEVIQKWFLRNELKEKSWQFGGIHFDLESIKCPVLLVSSEKDSVIPQNSNLCLMDLLPNIRLLKPNLGHVGIVASAKAKLDFWPKLVSFMR